MEFYNTYRQKENGADDIITLLVEFELISRSKNSKMINVINSVKNIIINNEFNYLPFSHELTINDDNNKMDNEKLPILTLIVMKKSVLIQKHLCSYLNM